MKYKEAKSPVVEWTSLHSGIETRAWGATMLIYYVAVEYPLVSGKAFFHGWRCGKWSQSKCGVV